MPFRIASCFLREFQRFSESVSVYDGVERTVKRACELRIPWPVLFHLLMRGEKFVFSPSRFPPFKSLLQSLNQFDRSVCIQFMFRDQPQRPMPPVYAPNTQFRPDAPEPWLRSLLVRLRGEVVHCWREGANSFTKRSNELYVDRVAKRIMSCNGWSAVRSDKDSSFVLVSRDGHRAECQRIVNSPDFEDPISGEQALTKSRTVVALYREYVMQLTRSDIPEMDLEAIKLRRFLFSAMGPLGYGGSAPPNPERPIVAAKLNYNLKTHKQPVEPRELEDNSANVTAPGAKLIGVFLRKFLTTDCPWVMPDSRTFLKGIELGAFRVPQGYTVIALDVKKFYPSVPREPAKHSVREAFTALDLAPIVLHPLAQLSNVLMDNQWVSFEENLFRRRQGVSMGGACSAEWADTHLAVTGDQVFLRSTFPGQALWYVRFRDDALWCIPVQWTRDDITRHAEDFTAESGGLQLDIQFPEGNKINWLDLTLSWGNPDGSLVSTLYRKPTYSGMYVAWDSAHSRSVFPAWVTAEVTRLATNCTMLQDAEASALKFAKYLLMRGYPQWEQHIIKLVRRAHERRRFELLKPLVVKHTPIPLVLPHCFPFVGPDIKHTAARFRDTLDVLWPGHPRFLIAWSNPSQHLYLKVRKYK